MRMRDHFPVNRPARSRRAAFRMLSIILIGCATSPLMAAPSTLSILGPRLQVSGAEQTMYFPVIRSGDPGSDVVFAYHTEDGSALAGIDYEATSGEAIVAADVPGLFLPVTIPASDASGVDRSFSMHIDSVMGIGPAPAFASAQTVGVPGFTTTTSMASPDLNGDGRLDLVVASYNHGALAVLLNTTSPGSTTATFATPANVVMPAARAVVAIDVNNDGLVDLVAAQADSPAISVVLNETPVGAAQPSFGAAQSFATNGNPRAMAAADLDGDGRKDIVVANDDGTLSIVRNVTPLGAAAPAFDAQPALPFGQHPSSVALADVNLDGRPDLIVSNDQTYSLSVFVNTTTTASGIATFASPQVFDTGSPYGVTAADVNNDGLPDLVSSKADGVPGWVSVTINRTAPGSANVQFAEPSAWAVGTFPGPVAAADVNGDGRVDLVVASRSGDSMSVLRNTTRSGASNARFAPPVTFATGDEPMPVVIADLDGDGRCDIIAGNDATGSLSIFHNVVNKTATLSFDQRQAHASGAFSRSLAAGDFNNDGKPDLVAANFDGASVSVFANASVAGSGPSAFGAAQAFPAGAFPDQAQAIDMDGDGRDDIVVANIGSDSVSVLIDETPIGAHQLAFSSPVVIHAGGFVTSVRAGDLNADGRTDLVVANDATGYATVLNTTPRGATTISFATPQAYSTEPEASQPNALELADITGDGRVDILFAAGGLAMGVATNMTPAGSSTTNFMPVQGVDEAMSHSIALADLNGDGRRDIVVADFWSVGVLRNITTPGATDVAFEAKQGFSSGSNPQSAIATDFDLDGRPDVADADGNTVSVRINHTVPGATQITLDALPPLPLGLQPTGLVAVDANGDGLRDLVSADAGDGTISVLVNSMLRSGASVSVATGVLLHDFLFGDGFD